MDSINSLNTQANQTALNAWQLALEQAELELEAENQAIGKAGNPQGNPNFESSNNSGQTGQSSSY